MLDWRCRSSGITERGTVENRQAWATPLCWSIRYYDNERGEIDAGSDTSSAKGALGGSDRSHRSYWNRRSARRHVAGNASSLHSAHRLRLQCRCRDQPRELLARCQRFFSDAESSDACDTSQEALLADHG